MSLRSVGSQLLQTAPTVLLDGASMASTSFWICVNPANDVVAAGGVEVFGDTGGVFAAKLSGTGLLHLQWTAAGGATSTCVVGLVPGTSYHVASTWQSGSQGYFLDGVEISTDTQVGKLGPQGVSAARPFRLGSDQAGTDVTLAHPTVWVGYTLTSSDVVAIRNGTAQPASIGVGSLALSWSLDGTAATAAAIGDAGLADASPKGVSLITVVGSAPTYQAGDLAYQASPMYGRVTAAPSGESIVLIAQDSQANPIDITTVLPVVATQSIRLSGEPAGNAITLSFGGDTTTPIATATSPPATYFLWNVPVIAGHSYAVAINYMNAGTANSALNYYFEVIDGTSGATLSTYFMPSAPDPNLFLAPDVPNTFRNPDGSGGFPVYWLPVAPAAGVAPTGATLQVRMTASNYGNMSLSGLRVLDLGSGSIAHYDLTDTANYSLVPTSAWTQHADAGFYGGLLVQAYGSLTYGATTVIVPQGSTSGAEVLQSALQSLASIGMGNVSVVDNSGNGSGSYQVSLLNALAYSAQPAIGCADPTVSVTILGSGGQGFTLNKADGTSVLLPDVVWSESGSCPFVLLPLSQSKPQVQTWIVRDLPCTATGYWDGPDYSLSTSVSKNPVYGWSAGLTLNFPAQRLPVGTYQWAITWPTQAFSYTTYAGQHACVPSSATQFLVQDGSGNTLATYTVDQTKAPSSYTDANGTAWQVLGSFPVAARDANLTLMMTTVGQSVAASGQVQAVAILDAVQFTRTTPDTSIVIGPGDSLSIPAGFVVTASGPLPAIVNMPIAQPSPTSIIPAFQETPKSMKIGWGVVPSLFYHDFPVFSNLAYLLGTMGTSQDPNFYPTRFHYSFGQLQTIITVTNSNTNAFGKPFQGTTFTPAGKYLLAWDGQPGVSVIPYDDSTTVTPIASTAPAGAPGNWQVYDIKFDPNLTSSPRLSFQLTSSTPDPTDSTGQTFEVTLSNLSIYPPDPADSTGQTVWGLSADGKTWTKPPKFWPDYLNKLSGSNCLRFMDPLNTNNQPVYEFAHYKEETHANRSTPALWTNLPNGLGGVPATVVSIRAATAAESPALPNFGAVVVIQTAAPHNFYDGCAFDFSGCGQASFTESYGNGGPATYPLDTATNGLSGYVIGVIDATHLLAVIRYTYGSMSNTLAGGYVIGQGFGTYWSLNDVVDLVKAIGTSVSRVHFNVPLTIDTSPGGGLDQLAAWFAANLPPWVSELAIEPGNEVWNNSFIANCWASIKSIPYGGTPANQDTNFSHAPFYARQGKAIHDAFAAAFASIGRASVVRRMFGSQSGNPQVTTEILTQCRAVGAEVDEICVAFYVNPSPATGYDSDQLPTFNRMTTGQLLDYGELVAQYGGWPSLFITNQYAAIQQANLPNTKVVGYEGSMSCLVPVDPPWELAVPPGNTPDFALRTHAARRHPRMYGIMLRHSQSFQDAGATAWCYYDIGGETSLNPWSTFESDTQPFGSGDPVADAIGITDPMNVNVVPNQIAGGLRAWANLVPLASPAPPIVKPMALRNGQFLAFGRYRGTARPTRGR